MSVKDSLQVIGKMSATLKKADGTIEKFNKNNLIVDIGFDFIADAIVKASGRPPVMSHIAVGTGTTAPASGDTTLESELTRKQITYWHSAGTKEFAVEATFDQGEATGALTEAGVFNDGVSGIMLDRVVYAVINKGVNDILTVRFTFDLS